MTVATSQSRHSGLTAGGGRRISAQRSTAPHVRQSLESGTVVDTASGYKMSVARFSFRRSARISSLQPRTTLGTEKCEFNRYDTAPKEAQSRGRLHEGVEVGEGGRAAIALTLEKEKITVQVLPSLSRLGGAVGGRAVQCGVCVRVSDCYQRPWACIINRRLSRERNHISHPQPKLGSVPRRPTEGAAAHCSVPPLHF